MRRRYKYVVVKVGTNKRNFKTPIILKKTTTRSEAQKYRTRYYKKNDNARLWIYGRRGSISSQSY